MSLAVPEPEIVPAVGIHQLLRPRWLALRNGWRTASVRTRLVYLLFAALGIGFWLGMLWFLVFVVRGFFQVEVFGPLLTRKLMEILLISLFMMLLFSNVVTALSTFFLSGDLELILALPVSRARFHYARLLETLFQSSWMLFMFGLPVFLAYGRVYEAGPSFWLLLVPVMLAFITIPTALGVATAAVLVNVFPARRTREFMAVVGILAVVAFFVVLRLLRPERFMDAAAFDSLAAYVAEIQTPVPHLLPPRWASDTLLAALQGRAVPLDSLGLLLLGAPAAVAVGRWVTTRLYSGGWARSQEARAARGARAGVVVLLIALVQRLLPARFHPLVVKDVRTFFRDPAQWSQLFLLASLVLVYLFSIHAIPMEQFRGAWAMAIRRSLAFLNLGMAAFVMAGVAIRFQFSAVSAEGRAFWVIRSAPVRAETFLWAKSMPGFVPMVVVGELLSVLSSLILEAGAFLTVLSALSALLLAVGISGIATALGATYPNFKADNAAKVASGPPGVLCMVLSLGLAAVVLALEALPVWLWLKADALDQPLSALQWLGVVGPLLLAVAICLAAGVLPVRRAARRLWSRGL